MQSISVDSTWFFSYCVHSIRFMAIYEELAEIPYGCFPLVAEITNQELQYSMSIFFPNRSNTR